MHDNEIEPTYEEPGYKVSIEWIRELPNGNVITIYDWKEYRKLEKTEEVEFHIGGKSKMDTLEAKEYLAHADINF